MVVFYITPASDLDGLVSRIVTNDSNLEIELEPKNIPSIRKGKQEKVTAHIHVKNIPFHLPEIEFSYKYSLLYSAYSINLTLKSLLSLALSTNLFTLPLQMKER